MTVPTTPTAHSEKKTATTATIVLAFASVYFFWGSTYTAIRIGAADMPALLFAGSRFLDGGADSRGDGGVSQRSVLPRHAARPHLRAQ